MICLLSLFSVVVFVVTEAASPGQKVDMTPYRSQILNEFNTIRRVAGASNMRQLKWSTKLEQEASANTLKCQDTGAGMKVVQGRPLFYNSNGELYDCLDTGVGICAYLSNIQFIIKINPTAYSQRTMTEYYTAVNADAREIGCAFAKCDDFGEMSKLGNGYTFACVIDKVPAGTGEPFKRGNQCTQCPAGTSCKELLCA